MRLQNATAAVLMGLLGGCLSRIYVSRLPNVPSYVSLLAVAVVNAPLVYFFAVFYLEQRRVETERMTRMDDQR